MKQPLSGGPEGRAFLSNLQAPRSYSAGKSIASRNTFATHKHSSLGRLSNTTVPIPHRDTNIKLLSGRPDGMPGTPSDTFIFLIEEVRHFRRHRTIDRCEMLNRPVRTSIVNGRPRFDSVATKSSTPMQMMMHGMMIAIVGFALPAIRNARPNPLAVAPSSA